MHAVEDDLVVQCTSQKTVSFKPAANQANAGGPFACLQASAYMVRVTERLRGLWRQLGRVTGLEMALLKRERERGKVCIIFFCPSKVCMSFVWMEK